MMHLGRRRCLPMHLLVVTSFVMMTYFPPVSGVSKAKNLDGEQGSVTSVPVPTMTRCWECMNYDVKGQFYDQCPMNASVDPSRAFIGNCSGKCFTHNDDLNDKLIIRGCTSTQWGLPNPLPADGCYPWYSEVWCVCSVHGCNGQQLGTPTTDKEFDFQVDYTKKLGHDSNAGSPVLRTPAVHISCALWVLGSILAHIITASL